MVEPLPAAPAHTPAERVVLKRITPPKRLPAVVNTALKRVEAELKRHQVMAAVRLGGSSAKGTYLKGDHDIDVFVRFSDAYDDKELPERLAAVLGKAFKHVERVHGSRDYFHVQQGSFTFEFIPVLHISSWQEAVNVTDMSPLHVDYVKRHTQERPYLASEIRLTKQFCKAAKVYGAESYIGGFSGHVIDLLNIYYGGFRALLEAAAKWPAKVVIDPERHHDNPLTSLNDAKTYAPLVIVDPIQPDRNSAAALSAEAFKRFRQVAAEYLAAPPAQQERFFTIKPLDVAAFKRQHAPAEVTAVTLTPLQGKKDVVGAKCMKVYEHLYRELIAHGFRISASTWEFAPKRAIILFACLDVPLPQEQEWAGPPVHRTIDAARFKEAHKTTFTRGGRLYAVERRKHRRPGQLIAALLKGAYVRERIKAARMAVSAETRRPGRSR